jgi:YHS domain-containing protein
MTSFLLRLLILLIVFWLVRRFLLQLFAKVGERIEPGSGAPGRMVKDPVCGMYLDPRLAISVPTKKGAFYFCSEECRNKFPMAKTAP